MRRRLRRGEEFIEASQVSETNSDVATAVMSSSLVLHEESTKEQVGPIQINVKSEPH